MSDQATTVLASRRRLAAVDQARRLLDGDGGWPDALARMLGRGLGVRCALVSMLDDRRLYLVGAHGLDPAAAREADLDGSLCRSVALDGLPVIVSDTAADARVTEPPTTSGFPAAAYAGFPVRDARDEIVGVVCAVHDRPADWSAAQLSLLDDAARTVATGLSDEAARHRLAGFHEADRQQAFMDALLDSLPTGVAAVDTDGRMVLFNRALRDVTGIDSASDEPMRWPSRAHMFHPDGRPVETTELPLVRAMGGETVRNVEQLLKQPGRRPRLYWVNAQPIVGPDGRPLGAMSTVQEITERRRAEALRICETACARALAEAADATDAGRAVLQAVATSLGWPYAELWLLEPAGGLRAAATWGDGGVPAEDLAAEVVRAGQPQWLAERSALALPVRSGARVTGVLTLFSDSTETTEPEDATVAILLGITAQIGQFLERRRAEDLALELAHTKDEYIALVGHELRTPLTSIASYTELLDDCPDTTPLADVRDLLEVIKRNNAQLRGTIEDLLDLAALDAGHAALATQPADVAALVRDALAAIAPAARAQRVEVHPHLPESCALQADPLRLRQVVDNLLHNAVKYSPDGGTVTVRLETAGGIAALTVADTGIGIPDEDRPRIFSRFYRTALARNRGIPGTGLGLAISAVIVARHGGTIALLPASGPGTTVRVELPLG